MIRFLRFLVLFLLSGYALNAQTGASVDRIRSSSAYYSAEGTGYDENEARQAALLSLNLDIYAVVLAKTSDVSTDISLDGQITSYRERSAEVSQYALTALYDVQEQVLSVDEKGNPYTDGRVHIFCWVSKKDVQAMFDLRRKKATQYVRTGLNAEARLQIDDALRNYCWAFILAKSVPESFGEVYAEFDGIEEKLQTYLPLKIKSVLSHIGVDVGECHYVAGQYAVAMHFTYCGHVVSSLSLHYYDSNSLIGPVKAKDGSAELELQRLPYDDKLKLVYDYAFTDEASSLDPELKILFAENGVPEIDARAEIPMKVIRTGMKPVSGITHAGVLSERDDIDAEAAALLAPVEIKDVPRIQINTVDKADTMHEVMCKVEDAIRSHDITSVKQYFTPEAYGLLDTLVNKTGKISLIGEGHNYEFIDAGFNVLARSCKVKMKFSGGKTFTENVNFRFSSDGMIESLAFGITQKAEDDIFKASAQWPEVSRFTILQFMEDYQTAYLLKRLNYIDALYSDDALIMTGTVLRKTMPIEGSPIRLGNDDGAVTYSTIGKREFINRLRHQFREREYVHLTYENNDTMMMKNRDSGFKRTCFAIEIKQYYNSPAYSDEGYLTLIFDVSGSQPIIYVRLWQPDSKTLREAKAQAEFIDLDTFVNMFR